MQTFPNRTRPDGRTTIVLTDAAGDELTGPYAVSVFRCGSCFIVGLAPETQESDRPDFIIMPRMIMCTTCGRSADGPEG